LAPNVLFCSNQLGTTAYHAIIHIPAELPGNEETSWPYLLHYDGKKTI
jgi:hypothetical protein